LTTKNTTRKQKIGAVGAAAVAVTGIAGAWVGTANASVPAASGKIYGCYSPRGGDLHVFSLGNRSHGCPTGFKTVVWNVKGARGATGARGTRGAAGVKGTHGTAGTNGTNGTAGSNGTQGAQGAAGAAGGPQGAQGAVGPQGAQGATGAQGPQGNQGPQGPAGIVGTVVESGASGVTSTATCPIGDIATGGGSNSGEVTGSFPVGGNGSTAPSGWQAVLVQPGPGAVVAFVVCAPGAVPN
jgi:hypothetical protein